MAAYPEKPLTEAELYSALPLEDGRIRVLDIHTNTENTLLTGQIHIVSLFEHPKFVALSYCWGSAAKHEYTHEIKIESAHGVATLRIADTAHAALTDVTNHLGHTTIWIDAICIDQSSILEREMQVPLMKAIYTQAKTVYVHLGGSTEATDTAMDWMFHISRRSLRGVGLLGQGSWGEVDGNRFFMIRRDCWTILMDYADRLVLFSTAAVWAFSLVACLILPFRARSTDEDIDDIKAQCIRSLLNRPWIQRAWTWQELVLAKEAVILCGTKCLPWHRFIIALSVLDLCCHHAKPERLGEVTAHESSMVASLTDSSKSYYKTRRTFSKDYHFETLRDWCLLSECWLRFGRTSAKKQNGSSKPDKRFPKTFKETSATTNKPRISFIEAHYNIHNVATWTTTAVSVLILAGLLLLVLKIAYRIYRTNPFWNGYTAEWDDGLDMLYLGLVVCALFVDACILVHAIDVLATLRYQRKKYCKLSPFATIPTLRVRKASDPRDLCYGLYGVLEAEGINHLTPPNYQEDPRSVFQDFLLDVLQWDSATLVLLLDCSNFSSPSWSPDWRVAAERSWLDERYFCGTSRISSTPHSTSYYETTEDSGVLLVFGLKAKNAVVNWLAEVLIVKGSEILDCERCQEVENLDILLDWVTNGVLESSGDIAAVCLDDQIRIFEALEGDVAMQSNITSLVDNRWVRLKSLVPLSNGFTTWFKVIEPYLQSKAASRNKSLEQGTIQTKMRSSSAPASLCYMDLLASRKALDYHREIWNKIAGKRRLFLLSTSEGVEFGTGSLAAQVGDQVFLVSGLPVPMMLRETRNSPRNTRHSDVGQGSTFSVIGPAFIPSMMRGEAWPKEKGNKPLAINRLQQLCLV